MTTPFDTIKSAIIGNPPIAGKRPSRQGVIKAFAEMQKQLEGAQSGAIVKHRLDILEAISSAPLDAMAWVVGDPTNNNNGIYQNASSDINSPVWVRRSDIPQFFISGINVGTGTANAIEITTDLPVPIQDGRALISIPILTDNTASPVTVSINENSPIPILTSSGANVVISGLKSSMIIVGFITGNTFRLISDQATLAILNQTEQVYINFTDKWLGNFAANPIQTPNGNPIVEGAIYWNTLTKTHRYYDGDTWETFPYATVSDFSITQQKLQQDIKTRVKLPGGVFNLFSNYMTGVNNNDIGRGLSPEFPFKSAIYAAYWALDNLNWSSFPQTTIVINLASNVNDSEAFHWAPHGMSGAQGGAGLTIKGGVNSRMITLEGSCIETYWCTLSLDSLYFASANVNCISASHRSGVYVKNCQFLQTGTGIGCAAISVTGNSEVEFAGDNFLNDDEGSAGSMYSIVNTATGGNFYQNGFKLWFKNNCSVTKFIIADQLSVQSWSSIERNSFNVQPQCKRFEVNTNSVVISNGFPQTFFPGETVGTTSTGGYIT